MLVAIIKVGTGIVVVEEFRMAADEATAVDDFCTEYTPPLNPVDYLGYDTGWSTFQPPAPTHRWAYNFDAPGLVQQALVPEYDVRLMSEIIAPATALAADAELGGLVAAPLLLTPDVSKIVMRVTGLAKTSGVGASLQLRENGNPISLAFPLADTAGVWTAFAFNTSTPPTAGLNVYTVWGQLGATLAAEIKYVSLVALVSKTS